jgi:hypothetical protein
MDSAARANLIRARFKARYPSKVIPPTQPREKPQIDRKAAFGGIEAGWFGTAGAWNWGKTEWIQQPATEEEAERVRIKRDQGKSALGRIADKWRPDLKPQPPARNPKGR